jgi:predicted glycoside hydrolase/deacetylase ChbG (UPF0249 family)
MVRWPAAPAAVTAAKEWPRLSLGLHLDLGEWTHDDGAWVPRYERVRLADPASVAEEIDDQLRVFTELVGRAPSHVDSHQHVHLREPARRLVLDRAKRLGVPVRGAGGGATYQGFYGLDRNGRPIPEAISCDGFLAAATARPDELIEIGCHPAAQVDFDSMYAAERLVELRTLCDPRLIRALRDAGFALVSFDDVAASARVAG